MVKHALRRLVVPLLTVSLLAPPTTGAAPSPEQETPRDSSIVFKVERTNEQLEMTVHTSRILTLDQKIPQAQVNNPDLLELTPLSPNEIQVSAKAAGITQINLWDEDKNLYTIDVVVYADVQKLAMLLKTQFPNASLHVIPVESGVLISGYVDKPENVDLIKRIAEEYFPKVIDNMTVSGAHQVLLQLRVMEVSRTKLRRLGVDWAAFTGNDLIYSGISGLITAAAGVGIGTSGQETFRFDIIEPNSALFGVLEALREDKLMKILAEPNIVAVSGEAASFLVGGEIGYQLNGGITGPSVEFKEYGTQIDFVAIVLGNGRIRLDVRPTVSEVDRANSIGGIPALKTRTVDTQVELQAGQTLAIAGLVQNRTEAANRGLPWVSEVPYLGTIFRSVEEQLNEVELLIMVTPQLVDPMDVQEVPPCGPGLYTTSPSDWELYFRGHLEVPKCCPDPGASGCPDCLQDEGYSWTLAPAGGMILGASRTSATTGRTAAVPGASLKASLGSPDASPGGGRSTAQAIALRNRHTRSKPQAPSGLSSSGEQTTEAGFIGPIGYDVVR